MDGRKLRHLLDVRHASFMVPGYLKLARKYQRAPKTRSRLPSVQVWAVWAREVGAPPTAEPREWMLLTTVPVHDLADADEKLEWYARRWGIEV